jgi:DNA-binding phage protein
MSKKTEHWEVLVSMLRVIAEEKKISQIEIAKRSGLIQSNISRMFALEYKPNLDTFLKVANAIEVNFFFEDKDSTTNLNQLFEKAMTQLGRRPDRLPKN